MVHQMENKTVALKDVFLSSVVVTFSSLLPLMPYLLLEFSMWIPSYLLRS